jgi:hypothetical protein
MWSGVMRKIPYGIVCLVLSGACAVSALTYAIVRSVVPQAADERVSGVASTAHALYAAVSIFHQWNGRYPGTNSSEILYALTNGAQAKAALLKAGAELDSWGTPFGVAIENEKTFFVRSAGPDGVMSNGDDKAYTFPLP